MHQCVKFKNTINNIFAFHSDCSRVTKFAGEDEGSKDGTSKKAHAWGMYCHLWRGFLPLSGQKFKGVGKTDSQRGFVGNREKACCIKGTDTGREDSSEICCGGRTHSAPGFLRSPGLTLGPPPGGRQGSRRHSEALCVAYMLLHALHVFVSQVSTHVFCFVLLFFNIIMRLKSLGGCSEAQVCMRWNLESILFLDEVGPAASGAVLPGADWLWGLRSNQGIPVLIRRGSGCLSMDLYIKGILRKNAKKSRKVKSSFEAYIYSTQGNHIIYCPNWYTCENKRAVLIVT